MSRPADVRSHHTACGAPGDGVLDNPVWQALTGAHARLGQVNGRARRYHEDVSPFAALPDFTDPAGWRDLAPLAGAHGYVLVTGVGLVPPDGWEVLGRIEGVQMVADADLAAGDPDVVPLGPADVPEMTDLARRTEPGPFRPRTVEFGGYLGIRVDGQLVAMTGERMRPPGWAEISAVCTDPQHRGRGYARRLIRAVAAGVVARGERPFLHAAADNAGAIRVYESLGFRLRSTPVFIALRPPAGDRA